MKPRHSLALLQEGGKDRGPRGGDLAGMGTGCGALVFVRCFSSHGLSLTYRPSPFWNCLHGRPSLVWLVRSEEPRVPATQEHICLLTSL